jgi:hypothetical protein
MNKLKRALLLTILLASICTPRCLADDTWVVRVTAKELDNYLNFKGSRLLPVAKASVDYSETCGEDTKSGTYEDLYYGNKHAIGCRRYSPLDLTELTRGEIHVVSTSPSGLRESEAYAAANAVERVFLDLYARNCLTLHIIVPHNSFATLVNGFYQNGFTANNRVGCSEPRVSSPTITFVILSDPPGESQRVMF